MVKVKYLPIFISSRVSFSPETCVVSMVVSLILNRFCKYWIPVCRVWKYNEIQLFMYTAVW